MLQRIADDVALGAQARLLLLMSAVSLHRPWPYPPRRRDLAVRLPCHEQGQEGAFTQ
jgi:hypothetical protein